MQNIVIIAIVVVWCDLNRFLNINIYVCSSARMDVTLYVVWVLLVSGGMGVCDVGVCCGAWCAWVVLCTSTTHCCPKASICLSPSPIIPIQLDSVQSDADTDANVDSYITRHFSLAPPLALALASPFSGIAPFVSLVFFSFFCFFCFLVSNCRETVRVFSIFNSSWKSSVTL